MTTADGPIERILYTLQERAKELNCLYEVDEILSDRELPAEETLTRLIRTLPSGLQYPDICQVRIVIDDRVIGDQDCPDPSWTLKADIVLES